LGDDDDVDLNSAIEGVDEQLKSVIGDLPEPSLLNLVPEWKTKIRGLAKKLRQAADKGYKLEVDFKDGYLKLETTQETLKIREAMKKLGYDREYNDHNFPINNPKLENNSEE